MRTTPPVAAAAVSFLLASSGSLFAATARADDELPSGAESPRIKPVLVADAYWAYHDQVPLVRRATALTTGSAHHAFSANLVAAGAKIDHAKLFGQVVVQFGDSVDNLYGTSSSLRHVQLASVGYRFASDFWFEAGVLPSEIGREDFVSTRNWNYSRAFVSDATPYFVTGARVGWRALPTLALDVTAFNGWNALGFQDGNDGKAGSLHVAWRPTAWLSVDDTIVFGRELSPSGLDDGKPWRLFEDLAVEVRPFKWLQFAVEAWGGREQGYVVRDATTRAEVQKDPMYYGANAAVRVVPSETTSVAVRAELFHDEYGMLLGPSDLRGKAPTELRGLALTLGWQPHPALLVRVEALHRTAKEEFFRIQEGGGLATSSSSLFVSTALSL